MLQNVCEDILQCKKVVIVSAHPEHSRELKRHLHQILKEKGQEDAENYIYHYVTIADVKSGKVNVQTGMVMGSMGVNVYADHFTFESECGWLFEQYKKWCAPQ
jgi:hypothetical protein